MASRLLLLFLIALPFSYADKLLAVASCQRGGSKAIFSFLNLYMFPVVLLRTISNFTVIEKYVEMFL